MPRATNHCVTTYHILAIAAVILAGVVATHLHVLHSTQTVVNDFKVDVHAYLDVRLVVLLHQLAELIIALPLSFVDFRLRRPSLM